MNSEQSSFPSSKIIKNEYNYIYSKVRKEKMKMVIDEKKNALNQMNGTMQNLILENRAKLSISGVKDVLSFDDQVVIMHTELGLLTVKGETLKISKLSLDTQDVIIEGEVNTLSYSNNSSKEQERRTI